MATPCPLLLQASSITAVYFVTSQDFQAVIDKLQAASADNTLVTGFKNAGITSTSQLTMQPKAGVPMPPPAVLPSPARSDVTSISPSPSERRPCLWHTAPRWAHCCCCCCCCCTA
jgi:hypothetical protein